jgi:hypothetical protein
MSLQFTSAAELQELIEGLDLKINNLDDLQALLQTINAGDGSPEARREAMAALERRQEKEHAHAQKMRQLEHEERMRALELGHDPHTADALAKIVANASEAVSWISVLVPLGSAGIAVGATAVVKDALHDSLLVLAGLGIIWGAQALVALVALVGSQLWLRRALALKLARPGKSDRKENVQRDTSTAIKELALNRDTGAY